MTADIICIHRGEGGAVCGHDEWDHSEDQEVDLDGRPLMYGVFPFCASCVDDDIAGAQHPMTPGRKCPSGCNRGWFENFGLRPSDKDERLRCSTCADSPVRGYLAVTEPTEKEGE